MFGSVLGASPRRLILTTACIGVVGSAAALQGAIVNLTASNGSGTTSFSSSLSWSNSAAPSAANDYTVFNGYSLRDVIDITTPQTFAGNSLTLGNGTQTGALVFKNGTGATVTVNNLTLNNGEIQAGGTNSGAVNTTTLAGNGITLVGTGVATSRLNSGTTGRGIIVTAPISGAGDLTINGGGLVTVSGGLAGTGGLNVANNATLVTTATFNLPTDLTRPLGAAGITGGNLVFTPTLGDRIVNIGGAAAPLTWGSATFNPNAIQLNAANGTGLIDFKNPLALGATARTITVGKGAATAVDATLSGGISSSTNVFFNGNGRLLIANDNPGLTGTATVNIGSNTQNGTVVRVDANNAFGSALVVTDPGGNANTGRIEIVNGRTIANNITFFGRNNSSVGIESINGNSLISGTISTSSGGSVYQIQSDADLFTLSGATGTGGVAIQAGSGNRIVTLQGAGNGLVSGIIQNGGGATAIVKAGLGTWTLSGANTYTGFTGQAATTVTGGTLLLGASDRLADTASLSLGGGIFSTGGFDEVLGSLTLVDTSTLDFGPGNDSVLSFADSSLNLWTSGKSLVITNWDGNVNGGGTEQFLVANAGLTPTQLAQITFIGTNPGTGLPFVNGARLIGNEVVPLVPEPATLAGLALTSLVAIRRRRA